MFRLAEDNAASTCNFWLNCSCFFCKTPRPDQRNNKSVRQDQELKMPKVPFQSALPGDLQQALIKHESIAKKLPKINLDRPTQGNRQAFNKLKAEVANLPLSPDEKEVWKSRNKILDELLYWGWGTNRNLLSAMFLAGAAIAHPEWVLRTDLAPSLLEARAAYAASKPSVSPSDLTQPVLKKLSPKGPSPFIQELAEGYRRLVLKAKGGKLDTAIKTLLQDKTKPLRVGRGFSTLDIEVLNQARSEHFLTARKATAWRNWLGDMHSEPRDAYAPTASRLKALEFKCLCTQDAVTDDEIFWTCIYMSVDNLEEIYQIIDKAILNGTIATVDLPIKWRMQGSKSILFKGLNPSKPPQTLNMDLGQANIYNGFSPWSAVLACVEDDDAEYDAVVEVVDTIGDAAEVISKGARSVAAMAGPSFLGVAAAAVASAASLIDLGADIVSAVVDIVNYFDNDDTIGFVYANGAGDYILDAPPPADPQKLATKALRASSRSGEGAYQITTQEVLSGNQGPFKRAWRYRAWDAMGEATKHDPIGFWGGEGDDLVELYTGGEVDRFLPGSYVAHEPLSPKDAAHAEWVEGPTLQANKVKVEGKVHWGVRGENSITYSPVAKVMSYTLPQKEKFVIES
jgi:hypothetical protein